MCTRERDRVVIILGRLLFILVFLVCFYAPDEPIRAEGNTTRKEEKTSIFSSPISFYQKYISDLRFGHCRFNPSCSEYAKLSINRFGIVKGSILAADRLIRCNSRARFYYMRSRDGRLLDPPQRKPTYMEHPVVPDWLVPELSELRLPQWNGKNSYLDNGLINNISFAEYLVVQGDCWRAETEYKRISFLVADPDIKAWCALKIANCYFLKQDWKQAAKKFLLVAKGSQARKYRSLAYYMVSVSLFNAGDYEGCIKYSELAVKWRTDSSILWTRSNRGIQGNANIEQYDNWIVKSENCRFLEGLAFALKRDLSESMGILSDLANNSKDPDTRSEALFLCEGFSQWNDIAYKSPSLAAGLSAILPGLGQIYVGRKYDGFRHFLFNSLLIYSVYSSFKSKNYVGGYLLLGIELPFYLGNVDGARRSAMYYNDKAIKEFVSGILEKTR